MKRKILKGNNRTFRVSNAKIIGSNNDIYGDNNIIIGDNNGVLGSYNDVIGSNVDVYGDFNMIEGNNNDTFGDNNAFIGGNNNNHNSFDCETVYVNVDSGETVSVNVDFGNFLKSNGEEEGEEVDLVGYGGDLVGRTNYALQQKEESNTWVEIREGDLVGYESKKTFFQKWKMFIEEIVDSIRYYFG
jgi:hypothetical protein